MPSFAEVADLFRPLVDATRADERRDVLPWYVAARMVARGAATVTPAGVSTEWGLYRWDGPDAGTYTREAA